MHAKRVRRGLMALLSAALMAATVMVALAPSASAASSRDATVTIIHGIPGRDVGAGIPNSLPVDISVDGACAVQGFEFRDIARVSLPAATYDIAIHLAGSNCADDPVIGPVGLPFGAGENATVIAHLDGSGGLTASKYTNDVSSDGLRGWQGRAAVHHTANAPAVDIDLFKSGAARAAVALAGVENNQSAAAEVLGGAYRTEISPAGGDPIVRKGFIFKGGQFTGVYAVGSLTNGTFGFIVDRQHLVEGAVVDPPAPEDIPAHVSVVHGIPGADVSDALPADLPVDISVNGACAITDFTFGEIARVPLDPGTYSIAVYVGGNDCGGDPVIGPADIPFDAGENATVIAHLDASGGLTASKYTNDVSGDGLSKWEGKASVHHTANAPAVDIKVTASGAANPKVDLAGVENNQSATATLVDRHYEATIAPAGGDPIFSTPLRPSRGNNTLVYAVGSLENGTFTLIVDVLPLH